MALPQQRGIPPAVHTKDYVESIDPASGAINRCFEVTAPADVPAILERARAAQEQWSVLSLRERCGRLQHLRDVILKFRDQIADVITCAGKRFTFCA